ncbi:MAG: hypothetical protein ACOYMD_07345 [Paludibacter sp.]
MITNILNSDIRLYAIKAKRCSFGGEKVFKIETIEPEIEFKHFDSVFGIASTYRKSPNLSDRQFQDSYIR